MTTAALALVAALLAAEPSRAGPDPLQALSFLEGTWSAEPDATGAAGRFSLARELDGRVLVRRNRLEMPARGDRPAGVHEDLLVVWPEGGALRADYWDNEGHVIHYAVEPTSDGVRLVSIGPGPRFRLTYVQVDKGLVEVRFEIAPPDKPEAFAPYLSGRARRAGP
jgi:hypothetical protein